MKNNIVIRNAIKSLKNQIQFKKKKKSGRLTGLPEGIELPGLIHRKWFAKSDSSVTEKVLKLD